MQQWVKCPTQWIADRQLCDFRFRSYGSKTGGSHHITALMCYIVMVHKVQAGTTLSIITYDEIQEATGRGRPSIALGIDLLEEMDLISRTEHQSCYSISGLSNGKSWGPLPCRKMYDEWKSSIKAFQSFTLRKSAELNAIKLFLLFVARRNNQTNVASIRYDTMRRYTGIAQNDIPAALSLLSSNQLVLVENRENPVNPGMYHHAYRLCGVNPRQHSGTIGKPSL